MVAKSAKSLFTIVVESFVSKFTIRRICVGLAARYVLCLLTYPFSLGLWSDQKLVSAVIGDDV
jgi:hypothetical protein